jgi:outer membrane protein assembly factor BamB
VLLVFAAVAAVLGADVAAGQNPRSARERLRIEAPAPLFPLEPAWTTPLPAPPAAGPAIDSGRVYVPLTDGTLAAADRDSGALLWTVTADVSLAPVTAGDAVVTAGPRHVTAWDAATGQTRWTGALDAPPAWLAVADGLVLVAVADRVLAWDLGSGAGRWRVDLPGASRIPPAVASGHVAVADDTGAVSVIALPGGGLTWRRTVPGRPGALAMNGDRVFVGTDAREFRALAVADGSTRWQWRTGGDVVGVRADGDRVFVTTLDNLVRALDAASGNQRWKATLSTRPSGAPLLLTNLVVVSGIAPRVEGFARKTGAAAGVVLPAAELAGAPALAPGVEPYRVALVVATRAGALNGYRPERMMFREPRSAPLTVLPGRRLVPEPAVERSPVPPTPARP